MTADSIEASEPQPRLPLRDTIGLSYSTYFRDFIDALRASWLWLIISAATTAVTTWHQWAAIMALQSGATNHPLRLPQEMMGFGYLNVAILWLACVSIAVAWHRLLILGEHPGFSASNIFTKDVWRYVGMGLAIGLMCFLPIAVVAFPVFSFFRYAQYAGAGSPSPWFVLIFLLIFVGYLIGVAVGLRLILLLPARAVGDLSLTFKQAWNYTRGNTWRLFWGIMATTFPLLLLIEIALALIGPGPFPRNGVVDSDFVTRLTAMNTIVMVYYLLILPVGIGFLSHAYRHFVSTALIRVYA